MAKVHVDIEGATTYELAAAILLYGNAQERAAYATVHEIERGKGGLVLGPGTAATKSSIADLVRSLGERAGFSGFISHQLLYVGAGVVAWWRAPACTRVWFDTKDEEGGKRKNPIGTRNAITPQPGLVFALAHGEWYVYAVKGDERPSANARLYRAPYFNVWTGGHICEGNIVRPGSVNAESLATFERAFFDSRFTHPNLHGPRDLTTFKGGVYAFWRALLDGRWKVFPERYLVDDRATLAGRMKSLEDNRRRRNG